MLECKANKATAQLLSWGPYREAKMHQEKQT